MVLKNRGELFPVIKSVDARSKKGRAFFRLREIVGSARRPSILHAKITPIRTEPLPPLA
jgi:hypothetical protein